MENAGDLWRQVEGVLPGVEEIYFAGGEPLVMEEHWRILRFLVERKMFDVQLNYTTNFSSLIYKGEDVLALWRSFERVRVLASLDGMGRRGEYLRKGSRWRQVLENRARMIRESPHVEFRVFPTASVMNAWHLPDLHAEWIDRGFIGRDQFQINLLFSPEEFCVQALPPRFKRLIEEKYAAYLSRLPALPNEPEDARGFKNLLNFMRARDLSALMPRFRDMTRRLDAIREERFEEIFQELAELMREA